jgi:F-type H+-transporting ATPase subunit delta
MASVAGSYARAFADVVIGGRLDAHQALAELHILGTLLASSSDLRRVWETPGIPADQKRKVLDAIVAREGTSRPVRNFVAVLIDHRRVEFFERIVAQFEKEMNQRLGFAEAEITSARELNAAEKRELEAQVQKLTGKKVRARYARDESLLGGAVVQVGTTVYDGSVRGQLERIREQMAGA